MKAAVYSIIGGNSFIPSNKIARFISQTLGVPYHDGKSIRNEPPLDVLIIVNGALLLCKDKEGLDAAIMQAKHVVWVQNDYCEIVPTADYKPRTDAGSPIRKAFGARKLVPHMWTTVRDKAQNTPASMLVNWNRLTYTQLPLIREIEHPSALLYYGSFRAGRVTQFDRYFGSRSSAYEKHVYSANDKFADRYGQDPSFHFFKERVLDLPSTISKYSIGLYIEDERSNRQYHSPANRFYEMLGCGVAMVFQPESKRQLLAAGIDVTDFVAMPNQVPDMISRASDIAIEQRKRWARDHVGELRNDLLVAWNRLQEHIK